MVVASAETYPIHCLDYLTGVERWREDTTASGRASIVIEPDCIVCAKNGYIDCFAPNGTRLWTQPLKGQGTGAAALGFPGNVCKPIIGATSSNVRVAVTISPLYGFTGLLGRFDLGG